MLFVEEVEEDELESEDVEPDEVESDDVEFDSGWSDCNVVKSDCAADRSPDCRSWPSCWNSC